MASETKGAKNVAVAILTRTGISVGVERAALARALKLVRPAALRKAPLPVLCNVLLTAEGGVLRLETFNLSLRLQTEISADVRAEGAVALPAAFLSSLLGLLQGDQVELVLQDHRGTAVTLTCGGYKGVLYGIDAEDFPRAKEAEGDVLHWEWPADRLRQALSETLFAAAKDDMGPVLSGILFRVKGSQLTAVAADGFRLAISDQALPSDQPEGSRLLPAADLRVLGGWLPKDATPVRILAQPEPGAVQFAWGNHTVSTRVINGEFPSYERIIPAEINCQVTAPLGEVRAAARLAALWNPETPVTQLEMTEDRLRLTGKEEVTGSGSASVVAQINGEPAPIWFNSHYLAEWLSAVDGDRVTMAFGQPTGPGLFAVLGQASPRYVLMPMHMSR